MVSSLFSVEADGTVCEDDGEDRQYLVVGGVHFDYLAHRTFGVALFYHLGRLNVDRRQASAVANYKVFFVVHQH